MQEAEQESSDPLEPEYFANMSSAPSSSGVDNSPSPSSISSAATDISSSHTKTTTPPFSPYTNVAIAPAPLKPKTDIPIPTPAIISSQTTSTPTTVGPSSASAAGSPPAASGASSAGSVNGSTKGRTMSTTSKDGATHKITKRRAARACTSCRSRKVRCDVVEGAPCGNCRWDGIPCVVQESRRRKKNLSVSNAQYPASAARVAPAGGRSAESTSIPGFPDILPMQSTPGVRQQSLPNINTTNLAAGIAVPITPIDTASADARRLSEAINGSSVSNSLSDILLVANVEHMTSARQAWTNLLRQAQRNGNNGPFNSLQPNNILPAFIRPLPAKIGPDEITYLHAKGSLTLPSLTLQSALIQVYAEYVHPFMPLLDLHGFLQSVNARNDPRGQISLFLYHCVMFAASAFIDMEYLRSCGYANRKAARKAFYLKARTLYDLDYEADRLILVQGLLLMTFWYESPDDQKDTWHWMGIATSLAHSIGLHRISSLMNVPPRNLGLYRRIWWSCFMRDQEIALGMRRPTRIKAGDFHVGMLQESDFDIRAVPDDNTVVSRECRLLRDIRMQTELAQMTIAKAKLCVLVSHMLKIQYSVHTKGSVPMDSASMLFPNKTIDNVDEVNEVDNSLNRWRTELPESCSNRPLTPYDVEDGKATIAVHRSLLHMIYYTTQSALHRPQFLGLQPAPPHLETKIQQAQEMARVRVRDAATQTTRMATDLHELELDRYLPTTGVTIVLPAMIIHMLEMRHQNPQIRNRAVRGFKQCMDVMQTLRTCYAAAEYAMGFLDAFLRKASIDLTSQGNYPKQSEPQATQTPTQPTAQPAQTTQQQPSMQPPSMFFHTPPPEVMPMQNNMTSQSLFGTQSNLGLDTSSLDLGNLGSPDTASLLPVTTSDTAMSLSLSLASAPIMPAPHIIETSPPHTDHEDEINGDHNKGTTNDLSMWDDQNIDLDGTTAPAGAPEFEWSGVSTGEFDVDYWLQFPTEVGATGTTGSKQQTKSSTQSQSQIQQQQQQQQQKQKQQQQQQQSDNLAAAIASLGADGGDQTLLWGTDGMDIQMDMDGGADGLAGFSMETDGI